MKYVLCLLLSGCSYRPHENKFSAGAYVEITAGFYKGCTGWVSAWWRGVDDHYSLSLVRCATKADGIMSIPEGITIAEDYLKEAK